MKGAGGVGWSEGRETMQDSCGDAGCVGDSPGSCKRVGSIGCVISGAGKSQPSQSDGFGVEGMEVLGGVAKLLLGMSNSIGKCLLGGVADTLAEADDPGEDCVSA
jgi:hypothetical protein